MTSGSEQVNHPPHYGGEANPYETIKVIEAWELGFNLGNAVKYISRAYKKGDSPSHTAMDLEKAIWYLDRELTYLKRMRYFAGVSKSASQPESWPEGSVERETQSSPESTSSDSPGTSPKKSEASSQD